jgi:hypothetical protein
MQWQPIETAPKDGTKIIGYGRTEWLGSWQDSPRQTAPKTTAIIRWKEPSFDDGSPGKWLTKSCNPYKDEMVPTHWMPLPEPPK